MKKLIGFLIVAVALACNCISQVPTQTIYAGATCVAPLPNYTLIVTVSDNCAIASYTQTPVPGTLLNATNPQVTVVLKATDVSGNVSQRQFNVVLLDTIAPVFNFPASMMSYTNQQFNDVYLSIVEPTIKEMILDWAFNFQWDAIPIPNAQDTVWCFNHTIAATEEEIEAYLNRP